MWRIFRTHPDAIRAKKEATHREEEITPTLDELRKLRKENHVYQTIYSTLRGNT